jgi:ketosteroid isomerase-like protein
MKRSISMITSCIFSVLIVSCNHTDTPLTEEEKELIKIEVINSIENHVQDIINQDYDDVMKFYVEDDYILFGDGTYWSDYETVDDIWGTWLPRWKKITKWELKNHKVHVFSTNAAIDYVEWIHERIEEDGDTTKAYGSWAWAMQKFPEGWRSTGAMIDHRYTAGPNAENVD